MLKGRQFHLKLETVAKCCYILITLVFLSDISYFLELSWYMRLKYIVTFFMLVDFSSLLIQKSKQKNVFKE